MHGTLKNMVCYWQTSRPAERLGEQSARQLAPHLNFLHENRNLLDSAQADFEPFYVKDLT